MSTTNTIPEPEVLHELTPSDYQTLYESQLAETERLKTVIAVGKLAPVSDHPQKDAKPATTAARLTAMVGQVQINNMTRAEKVASLGLDPSTVDDAFLKTCFGRGNTGAAASELMKTSPLRYRQLKEVAILLRIYGV